MGLIKGILYFTVGTLAGIYVAQNYNVPNVTVLVNPGLVIAKHFEQRYRKPFKPNEKS